MYDLTSNFGTFREARTLIEARDKAVQWLAENRRIEFVNIIAPRGDLVESISGYDPRVKAGEEED